MEATLQDILAARESRAQRQKQLLAQFQKPLICFTMNIAGPEKSSPLIAQGHALGCRFLRAQLEGEQLSILHFEQGETAAGWESYFVVDAEVMVLKRFTCELEDSLPVARLFDMDVLAPEGRKITRGEVGLGSRKCLLCENDVLLCSRNRAHSVEALQAKTTALLQEAVVEDKCQKIAALAVRSLLYEVCITPKPGLVDCGNAGSHKDMDIFTFMSSSSTLFPYFVFCAKTGFDTRSLPPTEVLARLRFPGKLAEQSMFSATNGINTHKGAIFSLGILCAAAGRWDGTDAEHLLQLCAAMTKGITQQELTHSTGKTAGQRLYQALGISGARGQAEAGFPGVLMGLAKLKEGLAQGLSLNDAGCAALLAILANTTDTNLLSRSDPETCRKVQREITALLKATPFPSREALSSLDAAFMEKNLSPGGCADLLALTLFLHFYGQ